MLVIYSPTAIHARICHYVSLIVILICVFVILVTSKVNTCFIHRTLIERARVECQNHWFVYNERMSVESCAQAVSNLAIQFGDSDDDSRTAMSRPFGVAVMFAGDLYYKHFHYLYIFHIFTHFESVFYLTM